MSNRPNRKTVPGHTAKPTTGSRTPPWLWIGVAAIVVVALGTAVLLSGSDDSTDLTSGPIEASGNVLPPLAQGQPDPAVGKSAPTVTGVDFANEPLGITNDGIPKVVIFLAHWCGVCQAEVPALTAWYSQNPDLNGVEVISVATAVDRTRGNWPPGAWLRDEGWPFPTMVDDTDNTAADVFGLPGFPFFVAIDAEGKVVERVSGKLEGPAFAALLEAARSGSTSAPSPSGDSTPFQPDAAAG
jgi:cytochrome c biogenesis protein CcmG, thiol:disulfide interchange protein DsbE